MVSKGINTEGPSTRKFFKSNYVDVVELITPGVYLQDDIDASGLEIKAPDQLVNCHMDVAKFMISPGSGLYVSAIPNHITSSIDNVSGFSQFFVSQNNLTKITPQGFERNILLPTGRSLNEFNTSSDFYNYLSGTLLSSIANHDLININTRTNNVYGANTSATHSHLIYSLSWLYFLNASGEYTQQPSSLVADLLTEKTYKGKDINLNDGLKTLNEFIFSNYEACAAWGRVGASGLIPSEFRPSGVLPITLSSSYTSGTQQLDKLNTLTDVVYSPQYSNQQDTKVKDAFEAYISDGTYLNSLETRGPFHRLLKAFSYSMFDRLEEAEVINLLYDINECPRHYLSYLADLIGWKLYGTDVEKMRLQLKNAVSIYKKKGTKASIQQTVNSLFSEDVFDVSANIHELWESYIPNIIYYALATESSLFKNFSTWTPTVASKLGVSVNGKLARSDSSMDENIRLGVDHILLNLLALNPEVFRLGGERFPIVVISGTQSAPPTTGPFGRPISVGPLVPGVAIFLEDTEFIFNYRGRDFPIPPWEKISYYAQCELTDNFINDLRDLLICFGVSESFSNTVREYIKDNTLRAYDSFRDDNGWLMFTSGVNDPPNLSSVLSDFTSNNVELFNAWSGKSSHFKFIMAADSFDFSKNSFTHESKYAPMYASKVTKDFSPAHAIGEARLEASATDYFEASSTTKWIINPSKSEKYIGSEFIAIESPSAAGADKSARPYFLAGAGVSAVHINGWRRGGRNPDGRGILRSDVNRLHLIHSGTIGFGGITENANADGGIVTVSRNSFRRRNYKHLLPTKGYYDRTGFNMPISWDASTVEHSYVGSGTSSLGIMPLGYIASAGYYAPVNDYTNLPDVYKICEGLNSLNTFSGVPSSSTFPCRGLSALGSDAKHTQYGSTPANYVDRGQPADIVATMHSIQERRKLKKANHYVSANFNSFVINHATFNSDLSFANSSTESDNWFPSSIGDYHNFKFERGLHQVYDSYTDNFKRHSLSKNIYHFDGPLIHGHLYGSGLFNGNFEVTGLYGTISGKSLIVSSISDASAITMKHPSFSGIVEDEEWTTIGGSYLVSAGLIASAITPSGVSSIEIRNREILSGIDFIHVSGSNLGNSFEIYKVAPSLANNRGNQYHIANTLIKLKSIRGLSRLRLSLKEASGLQAYSSFYPRDNNILIPEHKYKLKVRYLGGTEDGSFFGGVQIGAWIHTEIENDEFWSYTTNNKWERYDASAISENLIRNELSHYHSHPVMKIPQQGVLGGRCGVTAAIGSTTSSNPSIISEFTKDDYVTMEVDFHTFNEGIQRRELAGEPFGELFAARPGIIRASVGKRQEDVGDLHTATQNYIIEIFMVPKSQNNNKYVLLDHIGLLDRTLREKLTYDVSGELHPDPYSVLRRGKRYINSTTDTYTQEDIRVIFNFFNSAVGVNHYSPYASRVASETGELFGVSGGGRLSYRQQPEYYTYTKVANHDNLSKIDITN